MYLVLSPDGKFTGIMDGNQTNTGTISGSWTPTSGIGTGSFQNASSNINICNQTPGTFSFNMAAQTGTYSKCGVIVGSILFSRTGVLSMIGSMLLFPATVATVMIPLSLNLNIKWSANNGTSVSGFPLALNISNGTTPLASGIQAEINPLGNGAPAFAMTDTISVPYLAGSATNYTLSVGTPNCNIAGAGSTTGTVSVSGVVNPATVSITCN